jgi:hypothetical protein
MSAVIDFLCFTFTDDIEFVYVEYNPSEHST